METIQRYLAYGRWEREDHQNTLVYFWRFAVCPLAHMLKQHFFNKNSILTLENYKIWYRKQQLQKLQLRTPKANCKSKVKHLLCQETSYLFEMPKDWKADAFSLISKQYLPHPDPTLKPNTMFGEYTLDTHQSFIPQTWRISPISLHWQGQGHVRLTQWVARGGAMDNVHWLEQYLLPEQGEPGSSFSHFRVDSISVTCGIEQASRESRSGSKGSLMETQWVIPDKTTRKWGGSAEFEWGGMELRFLNSV